MYYGLVHYPNINTAPISQLRRKYDPTAFLIAPHITLMFPVPDVMGELALVRHLEQVLETWRPFPIHISGFCKSWDHWLLLTLKAGNSQLIRLNREIYSGILVPYLREDIEYIPHISLGLFVKQSSTYDLKDPQTLEWDEEGYRGALQEAQVLGLNYHSVLDQLQLVMLSNDFSRIKNRREFFLGKSSKY